MRQRSRGGDIDTPSMATSVTARSLVLMDQHPFPAKQEDGFDQDEHSDCPDRDGLERFCSIPQLDVHAANAR